MATTDRGQGAPAGLLAASVLAVAALALAACEGDQRSFEMTDGDDAPVYLDELTPEQRDAAAASITAGLQRGTQSYQLRPGDHIEVMYKLNNRQLRPYRIAVGDELELDFQFDRSINKSVVVRPDGVISLPGKGKMRATDLRPMDLARDIGKRYVDIAQVALKGEASLLAMAGLATQTGGVETDIENRARGTLGHPNMFAPYLLMMIPAAFGLALFARGRLLSLVGLAITTLGVIGIFVSKSRAPVALLGVALVAVAIAAVQLRALSVRAFLGAAILLTALGAAATIPFLDQIIARIGGDFASSISFRSDFNTAATLIWSDHPIWGIGPNNLNLELGRHFPMLAALIQETESFRDVGNARSPTVHNVYFLMLAETGLIGLVAFLYLLASALSRTIRAAAATTGAARGLCVGLAIGFAAQYLQQLVDFSLWYDSSWFTFAILIALAGTAPRCAPQEAQQETPKGAPKGTSGRYQPVMVWP